jgi:hypothetical protein
LQLWDVICVAVCWETGAESPCGRGGQLIPGQNFLKKKYTYNYIFFQEKKLEKYAYVEESFQILSSPEEKNPIFAPLHSKI